MFFNYIIYTACKDVYYKGITQNPEHRLWEHNNNKSRFTSGKGPWKLVYLQPAQTKKEALIEELRLKKLNRHSLELLIKKHNITQLI